MVEWLQTPITKADQTGKIKHTITAQDGEMVHVPDSMRTDAGMVK